MNAKVFILVVAIALLWLPSFQAQILEEPKDEDVVLMVKNAIDMLQEQMKRMEEQGLKLESSLHAITETLLNSSAIEQKEILPNVEKCSVMHDFIVNHNECISGTHRCSEFAECIDSTLSYYCKCLDGYSGDGFRCYDVDECLGKNNPCMETAECSNTVGSYNCVCKDPFVGDGHTCEIGCDSDDLLITDPLGCLLVKREQMTWEDSRLHCESLGMRLAEGFTSMSLIKDAFRILRPGNVMWIGARGQKWESTGKELQSDLYKGGQPDNSMEACIDLRSDGLGDYGCTNRQYPLCQLVKKFR